MARLYHRGLRPGWAASAGQKRYTSRFRRPRFSGHVTPNLARSKGRMEASP